MNLLFRKIQISDAEDIISWRSHEEVASMLPIVSNNVDDQIKWILKMNQDPSQDYRIVRSLQTNDDKLVCSFTNISFSQRRCEFGGYVIPNSGGNIYVKSVYQCMLKYAFETLNMNKVYGTVPVYNSVALKMNLTMGMQFEGRLRNWTFHKDKFWDTYILGLLKEEWNGECSAEFEFES